MGILTDTLRQVGRQSAVPSEAGAGVGQISEREQAIIDRHKEKNANRGSLFQEIAQARAEREIATRRQQRAYAEQPPSTIAQITVDPVREMISSLGDRAKVLDIYRKLSPEQRQEALNLAPGIAQQLGDDRGNIVERAASAVGRGISNTSQPIAELFGAGGTPEEIDFVRQLEAAASSEISPARPGDPWYERGAMGAAEMAPWMATTIGGGVAGGAAARAGGQLLARGASAGVPGAKTVFQGIGAAGRLPRAVGLAGATTKGTMEGVGTVAGIAAAGFPGQYAQEVDQLKELGMEDNIKMRLLAGTTAAVASALEGIVPNPIGGGKVPLTDGAVKAARQYLWEAAKKAPSEMSEEYLQGVTSGLGQHVAQYIDKNAEDKSIADAFQMGYEQTIEAALPMAFLLGVPAVGGAGMAANRARLSRLQEIRSKGFVSTEDAQKEGIEGKNRKERLANADKDIKELEQVLAEGATKPPATGQAQPPLAKGAEDASQVQQNEGSTQVQGDVGQGSQIPGSGEVRVEGQEQGGKEQSSKEPAAQEVPVDTAGDKKKPRVYREMAADELDSIINPNTSSGETFGGAKRFWSDNPDLAIGQGKNKGFVVELDPSGFKFQEHYKPGTAVPGVGKEFTTRHRAGEFRPGVRSITIKPGAVGSSAVRVKKFLESETNAGRWSKSEVEGGGAVYSPVDAAKLTDESGEQLGNKPGAKPRAKPEQSKAIVAYHGRRAVFPVSEFRIGGETSLLGRGIWFTDDEKAATTYSSIDPSVNVDVPGQIEALAEQLGVSYREAKEIFADGAESNVVKVALDIKRPMDLSPNTPIKVSEQQFKLAAAEADVTLPDNAYSRFVEKGNAKEQIEYLQRIKASQMVSRIASIQNHDAIIFRDGIAPRSKGTEYLILDKSAIQETASPEKPSQPTTTAEEPAAVPEPAVDFNRLVETNSPVNPQASLELDGIRYDQKKGIGSTGNNGNINYMGFVVVMTPDEFLGLNTVRNTEGDAGVDWIENAIREGEAIGSPSISVEVMEDGTFQVSGHEGRGRAHAIKKINPKARLLVHVFPRHKRARDFTPETIFKTIAPDPSRVSYGASRGSDVSPKQAVLNKKAYTSGEQVGNKTAEKAPTTQQPEDTATSEQDEFDAGMEELMAGLAKPESGLAKPQVTTGKKRPAGKPRSVKKQPAKTQQEKSDDDRARAAAKREEAKRKMREAFGDTQSKALSVFDPEVGMKVAQAAKLYIEAGALDFRAFIRDLAEDFGKPWVEDKAKYLESAWRTANKLEWVDSPTGKVSDILTEVSDETTQGKPGTDENAPMGDGVGESQGDAAATDTATDEGRDSEKDTERPGDSLLPDGAETARDDGREGSTGVGTDGDIDAGQSEQGPADAADTGGGSDAGTVDERLAINHVIAPNDDLAVSSITKSLSRNIKALEILQSLEKSGRFPDEAERKALAQYTGWGGLSQALDSIKGERMLSEQTWGRDDSWEKKWGPAYRKLKKFLSKEEFQAAQDSTENAHYTSKPIIQSIWKIAERLGYNGGRVLELGAGIGHFAGLTPSRVRGATQFTMVERDSVSSRITKMLYPNHEVVAGDMEEFKAVPGSVTLGIGNVPFAGGTVGDSVRRYNEPLNLHNYAIARHLDAVAPGGIVVAVSSHSTLDANIKQRKFLATKGELIGAIRLPNNAFAENAKTEVVTDILIFRRPRQGDGTLGTRFDQNADVKVKNKDGEELSRSINKYFLDNPEMVLGKHSAKGSMYGPDEYTVESTPGDLQEKLDAAIENLPRDLLGSIDVAEQVVASDESVPFGRLEIQAGKVVMGFGDKFVPIAGKKFADFPVHLTGKTGVSRAKDYIALRDLLTNVRNVMLDETASDEDVKRVQKQLNASYDQYVKKHGPLSASKTNIFKRDPDYYRVLALENERAEYNPETKKIEVSYEKAAIFTERVLGPQREPDKADSPADAMSVSIAWRGAIDSAFIGQLLGVSPKEAETKLLDEGLAFRNPATTELELSDLYLSGNVRAKLAQAEISAEEDQQYKRNVEALTKVLPAPVTIRKDTVRLGAAWIPEQVINAFATQEFGTDVQVTYNANTDAWTVGKSYGISETASAKYATERIDPSSLLGEVLNLRSIKIYDRVETGEYTASGKPKTTQTLNEKETQAAKHRASVLRTEFEKWVLGNPEVSQVLAKIYNDRYNNFVRTKYNGEFLVLPGANPEITLRPYQKDAIWRIINRGTSLLAHAVGAGKTFTMIGAAMEMRRLGLARRPMIVVQNATLGQFATSFQQMYPNANVLVADKNDLGKGKRQMFLNKISTGNWDAVVIAQSTFDNMASEPEVERAFIQDQLDLLEEAIREEGGEGARTPTVKQLVRTKKSLKARFDKLMGSRAKKEDNVTFEDLGADALFLDEAHAYKKPTFTTKLSQLVGLNVEASARSLATTIKVRSVQSAHNGRNVILATGTPVTNTLGEAWHMVNYVSPATNADFSSRTFDQFIGNFAQVEPTLTMNAGGQYVYKDAIVKFRNGHQLVEYINDSWDIVTPDALRAYMASSKKGFPKLRGGQPSAITVDRTPGVALFMDFIASVYEKYKGLTAKERQELSFIPALAYGASKAATLDIRLVVPNAAEEKNSKLQKAAEEIKRIYDESAEVKGAQLFFSDMKNPFSMSRLRQFMGGETIDSFTEDTSAAEDETVEQVDDNESGSFLYQELKRKLLGMGIPKEQIAFTSDATTDKQRQALFERVNNGDIRVLIGSTAKMGIGVNVQKKLVALHHFDTPWLPADLEQREGRILRFGNENDTVDILRYAMKKTLDGAIYMSTARKQKFIWQVLNGQLEGDSFEDPSSAAMLSIEEQLAAIQDDPVFFEKIDIQNRLREMELERQSFYDAKQRVADSLSREKYWLDKESTVTHPKWQRRLEKVEKLKEIKGSGGLGEFVLTHGKQTFTDPKKAAEFIKSKVDEISKYVIEHHDNARSFDKAGGLLSLGGKQKVEFEIGPARVVIGAEPKGAFVETEKGVTITEFSARIKSLAYIQESGGRHEFYEGTATTPSTFFDKMQSLPEVAQKEVSQSEARIARHKEKIAELEGLLGKQWEDESEYDEKKERLGEIDKQMLASKGSLSDRKEGKDKEPTDPRVSGESRSLDAFTSPDLQDRQSMGAARRKITSAADLVGDDVGVADSRYASPDSDFEQRWQRAARGISKKTLASKLREFWQELVKSTVRGSLPELPRTEQFGEARSAMHAYQNAPFYAQVAAVDLLKKTSKPLSASDYDLFTRIVIMRDQVEAASKGERLSYGLTPEKAKKELERIEALANDNERVQASLEYRKQWTEAMVDDFLSTHEYLGLDMSNRFKRENYFRHQVLYYAEAKQRGLGKKKVELSPNRSWLKGRTSGEDLGEAFDINANYLQAEWEVSTQMIADTKRAQAIGRLKRHYDKMRELKATAKQNNYVAVVGGQENMDEIEKLRGMMAELRATGSLDSGEKAQLKEWSERLWELDPTMPFRQGMAIAREQIERGADSLGENVPADFMRYVASLAKQDDSPLQGPAKAYLKAVSDRNEFIKGMLGDKYETWEDLVPDDHEEVAIRPGRAMFQAYSVPEQIASELMADLSKTLGIRAEDLRPLTALGSKYTPLVVPEEVAAQMASIDNTMDFGWLDHMVTRPMNAWKRLVLMGPTRFLKYNLRNLSEIDKVMSLNPAAIKEIPLAIRDLWKLYSGANDIPASVRDWAERGGTSTLVRVNELGELNELKEFARLIADKKSGVVGKVVKAPVNVWRKYWSMVGIGSDFRESILRYAAYLSYMKQLEAGKLTNYGGSVRSEVDGIKDNKDKAMRLSADLLGDYGDISQVGQFLRSRVAPFWSFQETNVRTYFRGLMNLASNEQTAIKAGMAVARAAGIGGLAKTPFLAYKLGRIAILFYGFKAMTTAFNQLLFPDDDDELPEEEKRKAHLTFGKNSKGEVQYFTRIGTAADVLDWVGLDSVDYDLRDVLDGRRTIRDVLNDMVRSPVDKAYGMLSPFMKVPTELAVGQSSYPHVGKPRPIRDRGRYIAQNLGLQKEYDKFVGNPSTPYSFTDLVLYKVEPGTAAYYMTLDAKFRWLKTARNRGVGYSDSNRGNALRSYKMAMRLNDQVAVDKYLAEYEAAEGTKEGLLDSMEWSHPAGGLSTIDAYLFYKSLAPVEQDEYREAERFYYSELLSEEQAKQIRARRDSRLRKLAFGRNKDGSPKGRPSRQSDETHAKYRERLNEWVEERKIAQEAVQEYRKLDGETEP